MKKYEIRITYSWGDEEVPIEIKCKYKEEAFERMIDLAATEAKVSLESCEDSTIDIKILPTENRIILYYGHDYEYCIYKLVEMEE